MKQCRFKSAAMHSPEDSPKPDRGTEFDSSQFANLGIITVAASQAVVRVAQLADHHTHVQIVSAG